MSPFDVLHYRCNCVYVNVHKLRYCQHLSNLITLVVKPIFQVHKNMIQNIFRLTYLVHTVTHLYLVELLVLCWLCDLIMLSCHDCKKLKQISWVWMKAKLNHRHGNIQNTITYNKSRIIFILVIQTYLVKSNQRCDRNLRSSAGLWWTLRWLPVSWYIDRRWRHSFGEECPGWPCPSRMTVLL